MQAPVFSMPDIGFHLISPLLLITSSMMIPIVMKLTLNFLMASDTALGSVGLASRKAMMSFFSCSVKSREDSLFDTSGVMKVGMLARFRLRSLGTSRV